jgi:hypothetical protein
VYEMAKKATRLVIFDFFNLFCFLQLADLDTRRDVNLDSKNDRRCVVEDEGLDVGRGCSRQCGVRFQNDLCPDGLDVDVDEDGDD